jgi:uncharacterized membrane protein YhaH (DUF805 family)
MNFGEAVVSYFRNYANIKGRASLNEYWFAALFQGIVLMFFAVVPLVLPIPLDFGGIRPQFLIIPWLLATATPAICVTIRRLHDVGLPTSAYFKNFIPFAGGTIIFLELIKPGQPHPNEWGNPVR